MPTNKQDVVINVDKPDRAKLKALAKQEGRTMKGMFTHLLDKYIGVKK